MSPTPVGARERVEVALGILSALIRGNWKRGTPNPLIRTLCIQAMLNAVFRVSANSRTPTYETVRCM